MNEPFKLSVPASKSHLNRLLVLQSFNPLLRIVGESRADDVVKMRAGIDDLIFGREVDCGAAGTVLRFLAVRASRIPGQHRLRGTRRLFQRPQTELASLLAQLNCQVSFGPDLVQIRGDGWKIPRAPVRVDRSFSSQFASAVLLNSWDLPETLSVEFDGEIVSDSYFAMTFEVVKRAGLLVTGDRHIRVQPKSLIQDSCLEAEIDLSCAFSISAVAIARGRAVAFENWPTSSLQPDMVFVDILRRMGCTIEHEADRLTIVPTGKLRPINVDLGNAPDLFPVLAVLCAHADGESRLSGAPHFAVQRVESHGKDRRPSRSYRRKIR